MAKLSYETAQELLKGADMSREEVSIIYAQCDDHESALSLLWAAIAKIESDVRAIESDVERIEDDLDEIKED